jgi:hypothetical protein
MRNAECVIYISTTHGATQTYVREKDGWTQTSSRGVVRRLSAEQLLSHLLPPLLADYRGQASVRVERRAEQG